MKVEIIYFDAEENEKKVVLGIVFKTNEDETKTFYVEDLDSHELWTAESESEDDALKLIMNKYVYKNEEEEIKLKIFKITKR